jgi:DNA polymerase III sliding clamp (beta) subunit (PCNA family)
MLNELKFVQGAVAKKDYLPALTHFCIENGTVRGYNGTLALCSPIPFDIECKPKAAPMVQAIRNCTDTVVLSMTKAGRLSIKSGKFKALIDCVEGETSHVEPEGDIIEIDGQALLNAVKALQNFIGDDASRPWSNGVLLKGQSAFATNNVILVEYWTGVNFPTLNLPRTAVREILRVDEPPILAQATDTSFTLHYSNKRWIRTQLLSTDWPDLAKILERESVQVPVNPELFVGLEVIKSFTDKMGRVTFHEGSLRTNLEESEGADYELEGLTFPGSYNLEMLASLKDVVKTIDFTAYPRPCIFHGDRLRGAIIGMRMTGTTPEGTVPT